MNALQYKEFQGSVEFEDGRLVIQILHIDDTIITEIDSAQKAQAAFEELVEDYLATCAELGKEPCKPFKGSFNVRITSQLHRQVAMSAAESCESMNAWIAKALEEYLERQKAKKFVFGANFFDRFVEDGPVSERYSPVESLRLTNLSVWGALENWDLSGKRPSSIGRRSH